MTRMASACVFLCAISAGCMALSERDRGPAFDVAAVDPPGGGVDAAQTFRVTFSRPLREGPLDECAIALAPAAEAGDALVKAFNEKKLSAAIREIVICGEMAIDPDLPRVTLTPARALRPGAVYRLLVAGAVRDADGYSLREARGGAFVSEEPYRVRGAVGGGRLVISEVMANPKGPEPQGEWVELFNPGDAPIDLQFWRLSFTDGPTQEIAGCGRGSVIPPGGYGLVGAEGFAPADGAPAACVPGRLGQKGLVNYAGQVFALENPRGERVASYGGFIAADDEGFTAERVDLDEDDRAGNWAVSKVAGGTPGAKNSVSGQTEAPPPPRLVRFDPSGAEVRPSSRFNILFDQPVVCPAGACVGIYASGEACLAGRSTAVDVDAQYVGTIATAKPVAPLEPSRGYFLGVRGVEGPGGARARPYCLPFKTTVEIDSTPPQARLRWPESGAGGVPATTRYIEVEISEQAAMDAGAIRLVSGGNSPEAKCTDTGDGLVWRCDVTGILEPGRPYDVAVAGPVGDAAGNLAPRGVFGRFWTGGDTDSMAPSLAISIRSAAPRGIALSWEASEPCIMHYMVIDAPSGDELLVSAVRTVAPSGDVTVPMALVEGRFEVSGWCVDPSGNVSGTAFLPAGAATLGPPVAMTEVMANPAGKDDGREWIEVYNHGAAAIDLSGWRFGRCGEEGGSAISPAGAAMLSPGEYVLIGPPTSAGQTDLPWGTRVIEAEGEWVKGGLSNAGGDSLCIHGLDGGVVSSFNGYVVPAEGLSAERVDPLMPDTPENWRVSDAPGGSPGGPSR